MNKKITMIEVQFSEFTIPCFLKVDLEIYVQLNENLAKKLIQILKLFFLLWQSPRDHISINFGLNKNLMNIPRIFLNICVSPHMLNASL